MDENMIPNETNEAVDQVDTSNMTTDEIKEAARQTLKKVHNDAMILGYRVACQTISQMLMPCLHPNASRRELERSVKKVIEFAGKALKQQENTTEETVQN